jgi:hypothetical protein
MRWYITINGETHGPVDESVIKSWMRQKQVPPGSMVAPEGANSSWLPVEKSSFARQPPPWIGVPLLIGLCGLLYALCSPEKRPPPPMKATPAAEPQAAAVVDRPQRTCVLSIPGSTGGVLLFPTEEGIDEFGKAAASGDEEAMAVTRRANGGFFVESGTKCTWVDVGFTQTKVRVLAGAHTGRAGYVPTEWTRGR